MHSCLKSAYPHSEMLCLWSSIQKSRGDKKLPQIHPIYLLFLIVRFSISTVCKELNLIYIIGYFHLLYTSNNIKSLMATKFNLPVASTQEPRPVRHDINEDKKSEKLRTMYLYTMMFLSIASPILYESSLIVWFT